MLRGEVDKEWVFADGSYIRAHQLADQLIKKVIGAEYFTADKGYDSDPIRDLAQSHGMKPVIPRKSNSVKPNPYFDKHLYKLRHLVENLFARLESRPEEFHL